MTITRRVLPSILLILGACGGNDTPESKGERSEELKIAAASPMAAESTLTAQIQYAVSKTQPSENSASWLPMMPVSGGDTAVTTLPVSPADSVWFRARAELPGKGYWGWTILGPVSSASAFAASLGVSIDIDSAGAPVIRFVQEGVSRDTVAEGLSGTALRGCCRIKVRWRVVTKIPVIRKLPEVTIRPIHVTVTTSSSGIPRIKVSGPSIELENFPEIRIGSGTLHLDVKRPPRAPDIDVDNFFVGCRRVGVDANVVFSNNNARRVAVVFAIDGTNMPVVEVNGNTEGVLTMFKETV